MIISQIHFTMQFLTRLRKCYVKTPTTKITVVVIVLGLVLIVIVGPHFMKSCDAMNAHACLYACKDTMFDLRRQLECNAPNNGFVYPDGGIERLYGTYTTNYHYSYISVICLRTPLLLCVE